MAKQINCECGYVARGESEDEVIALIRDHMRSDLDRWVAATVGALKYG